MTFADHLFAGVLVIVAPIYSRSSWAALQRTLAEGRDVARLANYGKTIVVEWSFAVVILITWLLLGRSAASIGLTASADPRFAVTLALAASAGAFLVLQARRTPRLEGESRAALRRQLAPVQPLLPRTADERDGFLLLSATAGFCEELLYRGFLISYLAPLAGFTGAAFASAIIFGVVHSYQGRAGAVRAGAVGLVMSLLYVVSGSIWPAVVLHVAIDVQGGLIGYALFARQEAVSEPEKSVAV